MSDPLDNLLAGLRGQRPPVPFAPAAAVRQRGRQRAQRQAVSIGVAVLVVTGLSAGGAVAALGEREAPPVPPAATTAGPPLPATPSPSPTPTPAPPAATAVPAEWLLEAGELPGTGWQESTGEMLTGLWYWDGAEPWCPEYRIEDYSSVSQRIYLRIRGWLRDQSALPERIDQLVEQYPVGVGTTNLDDVRAFIELCSRRPEPGDQVAPTYYEIEETGFAGDESMLIRVEQYMFNADDEIEPAGEAVHIAVVRVGDLVTTISFLNLPDEVQSIAQRAADRLR